MIIQELTELYGVPSFNKRMNWYSWVVTRGSTQVSIQHSSRHYCGANTAEVAIMQRGKIVDPKYAISDMDVIDMFGGDVTAGWCSVEEIKRIVSAVREGYAT